MHHQLRRFNTSSTRWSKVLAKSKVTASKSKTDVSVIQAAQNLRLQSETPIEPLMQLVSAVRDSKEKVPSSVFRLMKYTLDSTKNYRGLLTGTDLQELFRVVSKTSTGELDLLTKLYADIYRHSRLSEEQKIANGLLFYENLRSQGKLEDSDRMVEAFLRSHSNSITTEDLIRLLEILRNNNPSKESILTIFYAFPTTESAVLSEAINQLLVLKSVSGLEELVNLLYFTNAHNKVSDEMGILFLDAFLQLPVDGSGGSKILKVCLSRLNGSDAPLEVLELLLMSSIHFQEPVQSTVSIYEMIKARDQDIYTKETWDVLAQFSAYQNCSVADLQKSVLDKMPAELIDCKTLVGVLKAGEKAQATNAQINSFVEHFDVELDISPDASVYYLLIKRHLAAVEVDSARSLFLQSNTDWNLDDNRYLDVLSELLVSLCRTTGIPRQQVVDTYNRVSVFASSLQYEAQLAMLEMFLHESEGGSTAPAGIFLADQFGETPDLKFSDYREIFELLYHRLLVLNDEVLASELCVLLNSTIILPYEAYYPICSKMCSLGRPDVAHLFFRQLRNRSKTGAIKPPGEEIYLLLFGEYAKAKYEEGVYELDTYLRLDVNNEMTVPILNRMLAGYAALQDSHKIAHLWTEISSLPRGGIHGPNDETMSIWINFLGRNFTIEAVDDVWQTLPTDFKLKPTLITLKQYIVANCYHGYYSRALEVLKMAPTEYGIAVNADMLQTLYNWTLLSNRKEEVKEYAIANYPEIWNSLVSENKLKNVLLPSQNQWGDTDESSRRWEAIQQLEAEEQALVANKK